MAAQSNLDYQTFWAPRPLSRPRCAEGPSHYRSLTSQSKPSLPTNDGWNLIGLPRESLDLAPGLGTKRDEFIYISDDAASDMNDASDDLFDETLPSLEAIVQSLEEAGKIGSTVNDCDQTSLHKDNHEATGQWAHSTRPEPKEINETRGPSADLITACAISIAAPMSRIRTPTPTSDTARSRTSSPGHESSLLDAASPRTRCTSLSADDEGKKETATLEFPQRVDSPPYYPTSPDHDCSRVDMGPKAPLDSLQRLVSGRGNYVSNDAASDIGVAVCDEPLDKMLPSGQATVQALKETRRNTGATDHCEQLLSSKDTPSSPVAPEQTQVNHTTRLSSNEPVDCTTGVASSILEICSATATMSPSKALDLSPESQPCGAIPTNTSCTAISAADEGTDETQNQKCIETNPPAKSGFELCAPEYPGDNTSVKPLMSRVHPQPQNKRPRKESASQDPEQPEAESLPRASDDPEYCPSTSDELEDDSDSRYGDDDRPARKRRNFRTAPRRTKSPRQEIAPCESAGLGQAHKLVSSATPEDAHGVVTSTDAVFDEWILQDVVLKRTIMDGKATFLFQFDWDLCMNHGEDTGRVRRGSDTQGRGRSIMKSNKRRGRKPRNEAKGRRCGVCGESGHNARTCQSGMEVSNEEENN